MSRQYSRVEHVTLEPIRRNNAAGPMGFWVEPRHNCFSTPGSEPKMISIVKNESGLACNTEGFSPIKVQNLIPGLPLHFDIYFPKFDRSSQSLRLHRIFSKGGVYSQSNHEILMKQDVRIVYVKEEDEEQFASDSLEKIKEIVLSSSVPSIDKAKVIYSHAEYLVEKSYTHPSSFFSLAQSFDLIEAAAIFYSIDEISADELVSIFSKDYYTFTHSVQVCLLGMAFCAYLGWTKKESADYGVGALFHDVGKNRIDDRILLKPSRLEPEEFEQLKKHPILGYKQLKVSKRMSDDQLSVVLQHHEDMDGKGYPAGLKGDEIHRYARVARVIDCYDALSSKRSYKNALPRPKAILTMNEEMSGCFDPRMLESFNLFSQPVASSPKRYSLGARLSVELGSELSIELQGFGIRFKGKIIGMEPGSILIVQLPDVVDERIGKGSLLIVRYLSLGRVYGFQASVLSLVNMPLRMAILAYPQEVECFELRRHPRFQCLLPCKVENDLRELSGAIVDISIGGCRFVACIDDKASMSHVQVEEPVTVECRFPGIPNSATFPGIIRNLNFDGKKLSLGLQFRDLNYESISKLHEFLDTSMHLRDAE